MLFNIDDTANREALPSTMADSPRIKGWKNLTVKKHVSASVTTQRELFRQRSRRPVAVPWTAPGHISAPIISPSKPIATQQRKRRKVEAARLIPALILLIYAMYVYTGCSDFVNKFAIIFLSQQVC